MRNLILACLLALLPLGALATPSQSVDVEDQLIGINDTHLFLIRTLNDNLGNHHLHLVETVLVAKSLTTGLDEEFWPVRRVYYSRQEEDVVEKALENTVNPYDILADKKAIPLSEGRVSFPAPSDIVISLEGTEISLTTTWLPNTYRISHDWLKTARDTNIRATRQAVPPFMLEGDIDMLLDRSFDVAADCEIAGYTRHFDFSPEDKPTILLVKIDCRDNEDGTWRTQMYYPMAPNSVD